MGVISSNSFDPAHGYVGVRLQQGVAIVDRDWNEMEDIRKFELRAFLKWFIGDGVPTGSNAFKIDSPGGSTDPNDFIIRAGIATAPPDNVRDSFLVDGEAAVITTDPTTKTDPTFTSQPLHASQPGASALAAAWGVPVIPALSLPTDANGLVVYLDVWERLVTPTEDPQNLILPGLGTESCARLKREWAVRVRTPTPTEPTVPVPGNADYLPGHGYSALATIVSQNSSSNMVNPGDITDLRQTRLTLADLVRRVSLLDIPVFNQFTPTRGGKGTPVTLYGRNFTVGGIPQVKFGAVPASPVQFILDPATGIALTATVPANVVKPSDPRDVTITIITGGGTAVSGSLFTVIGPPAFVQQTPNQFSTNTGPVGSQVTLNGTNFDGSNPKVAFLLGTTSSTPATIDGTPTATQIVVTVPSSLTSGLSYNISVTTDEGSTTSTAVFTVK